MSILAGVVEGVIQVFCWKCFFCFLNGGCPKELSGWRSWFVYFGVENRIIIWGVFFGGRCTFLECSNGWCFSVVLLLVCVCVRHGKILHFRYLIVDWIAGVCGRGGGKAISMRGGKHKHSCVCVAVRLCFVF